MCARRGCFGVADSTTGIFANLCVYLRDSGDHEDSHGYGAVPHGHWRSRTFTAALRYESIEAPVLIDGSVGVEVFMVYFQRALCPQKRLGETVILDNLSTHKVQCVNHLLPARDTVVRMELKPWTAIRFRK